MTDTLSRHVIEDQVSNDDPAFAAGLPVAEWRMFNDLDLPGAVNMAVDEALLESVIGGGQPVVRFYSWRPAALSLGVNQPVGEIDCEECANRGFSVVRRITGGRAVLHQHELTYSVIASESDPRVSGGVIESYRKISAALVEGLQSLGTTVTLAQPNRALFRAISASRHYNSLDELAQSSHGAICFDSASAYELTAHGKKLVGSAQARRGGALLQHGSILLDIDWDSWVSVFAYASDAGRQRARQKLPMRMTSLREELGRAVTAEEVQTALKRGFENTLAISLEAAALSDGEATAAGRFEQEKFGAEAWTARK